MDSLASSDAGSGIPPKDTDRCVACGTKGLSFVEAIRSSRISEAWAADRRADCRQLGRVADWLSLVQGPLGGELIRIDRCERCGLEMSSPRTAWSSGLYGQVYPERLVVPIRWEFDRYLIDLGEPPQHILELGCGTGTFLAMAEAHGHHTTGLDHSPTAIKEARGRGIRVARSFEELRESGGNGIRPLTFDAVAMFHVIEHLHDPGSIFEELESCVRIGTKLAMSCPGPRRFTRLLHEQQIGSREFWDYPPHHVLRWTIPALRFFLESRGWRVIEAVEEPLAWVGASSHLAITRAMYGSYIQHPLHRRLGIARAMLQTLLAYPWIRGLSLYVLAERA